MGRWTQYDEVRLLVHSVPGQYLCQRTEQDDYRLPEGMKRVGYDSDSGKFYFRDRDGSLWEGAEGAQYGEMTKGVCSLPVGRAHERWAVWELTWTFPLPSLKCTYCSSRSK